ncbi:nucleotide sugar dehydrogenase [Nocardioides currus]|uniref:Nucleotide sugar dehydrogenase n=1 Tax=Nocardioides currus TaxID=2133958 RepID=A0A2R7Z3M8_9ACTN|nr:nucleotide sugar dehydrogenase [Nocardioides currus]PUA83026.1 nucleotide sugar dehydrogenase [Nocardioides currus]
MKIAVIGLGKIGLPLAAQFADAGHDVIGVDVHEPTVATVNEGRAPFPGEAHLDDHLARLVPAGRLRATTSYAEAIPPADAVVVVVPLFVDGEGKPDFGWMDSATRDIAANLGTGTLVVYETTLPVGTTRTRWKPALEAGSGLTEGTDFHVVFSPERVLTGRVFEDLRKYPKLVGGLSTEGAAAATAFYEQVLTFDERPDLARGNGVWDLGSAEAAEMAKLAETTYRDVNIGLANQFAVFAEQVGVDVHEVIAASNSQPYSHLHQPGISVGGHCIPVYPRLYLSGDPDATVVSAARAANAAMPAHAVKMVADRLGDLTGLRVAVLGAAYRGAVKETAFSGVFDVVKALEGLGAVASVHDPMYTDDELAAMGFTPYHLGEATDAAIIQTDHAAYAEVTTDDLPGVRLVLNGRPALELAIPDELVITIGRSTRG